MYIYIHIDTYILREFFPPIFKTFQDSFFEEHLKILTLQPHATWQVYWGDFGTRKIHKLSTSGGSNEVIVPGFNGPMAGI